jgi:hypothetical protein
MMEVLERIVKGCSVISPDELAKKLENPSSLNVRLLIDQKKGTDIDYISKLNKLILLQRLGCRCYLIFEDDPSIPVQNEDLFLNLSRKVLIQERTFVGYSQSNGILIPDNFIQTKDITLEDIEKLNDSEKKIDINQIFSSMVFANGSSLYDIDVDIAGSEDYFRFMLARTLNKINKKKVPVLLFVPSLNKCKSKFTEALETYVGIMSIDDSDLVRYFEMTQGIHNQDTNQIKEDLESGVNPFFYKERLAKGLISILFSEKDALNAKETFDRKYRHKEPPDNIPGLLIKYNPNHHISVLMLLRESGRAGSNREAKLLVEQKAVSLNGVIIDDPYMVIKPIDYLLKVGKRFYKYIRFMEAKE